MTPLHLADYLAQAIDETGVTHEILQQSLGEFQGDKEIQWLSAELKRKNYLYLKALTELKEHLEDYAE